MGFQTFVTHKVIGLKQSVADLCAPGGGGGGGGKSNHVFGANAHKFIGEREQANLVVQLAC